MFVKIIKKLWRNLSCKVCVMLLKNFEVIFKISLKHRCGFHFPKKYFKFFWNFSKKIISVRRPKRDRLKINKKLSSITVSGAFQWDNQTKYLQNGSWCCRQNVKRKKLIVSDIQDILHDHDRLPERQSSKFTEPVLFRTPNSVQYFFEVLGSEYHARC